ncbi:MAG: branched-chain amino acid ABC transporter permease [Marinosulfonomonas sp.]|nr:branched-chain amino acid ABC transporter permease [Marinosulfonomonas sp.]
MELFAQIIITGLAQGSIYAILGLGFAIVGMSTRVLNIAQGAYALIGGFLFLTIADTFNLPLVLTFALCMVAAAVLGVVTELVINVSTRPWKPVPHITSVLATLALLVAAEGTVLLIWGSDPVLGKPIQRGTFRLFGAIVPWQYLWNIVALIVMTIALQMFLFRTWTGRAMRATAENVLMSYLLGINVRRIGAITFALGAAIGATGGILASPITWIDYQMGSTFMLFGLLAALIGGENSVAGPMIGGLLLGLLENVFLLIPGLTGGLLKQVVPMLLLLAVLVVRPQGLLGKKATA